MGAYPSAGEPIAQTFAPGQKQYTFDQRTEVGKKQGEIAREGLREGEWHFAGPGHR